MAGVFQGPRASDSGPRPAIDYKIDSKNPTAMSKPPDKNLLPFGVGLTASRTVVSYRFPINLIRCNALGSDSAMSGKRAISAALSVKEKAAKSKMSRTASREPRK